LAQEKLPHNRFHTNINHTSTQARRSSRRLT
jgi:hypothetical protein